MPKIIVPSCPIPRDALSLGRLITNPTSPAQDFHDPIQPVHDPITTHQTDVSQFLSATKNTKLGGFLTSMLGLEFSRERSTLTHIQAVQRTVYTLPNPTDAFEAICAEDEEARRFLEKCYSRGLSVYMVVGIHTFHDARVEKQGVVGEKVVQQVTVPVVGIAAAAAGGVPLVGLGDVLDVGVEVEGGRDEVEATAFFAPGEQVFGIEYRKVSYDWFVIGGDVASSARLKKKSAWECCWMRSGPPQPGEEAYAVEVDVSLEPDKDDIGAGCELVVMAGGQGVEQVFVFNS